MNNNSGGVSGAISDPMSSDALVHAYKYYEEIRHRTDDVYKIARMFPEYTAEQILKVKNYLFVDTHVLSDGIRRFDACFEIAETWQRLSDLQQFIQPHDRLLIPHELLEMELINKGMSQEEAHIKTCESFDYPSAAHSFYKQLQTEKSIINKTTISGAINYKPRNNWDQCL